MTYEPPPTGLVETTDEFRVKFTGLKNKLKTLQYTQIDKILELGEELAEYPLTKALSNEWRLFLSNVYLYVITEEILLVEQNLFIEDFYLWAEKLNVNLLSEIEDEEEREKIIENVVKPYVQSLSGASEIIQEMMRYLILKLGIKWEEELIASYVLNDFLKPMMLRIMNLAPEMDIRLQAAIGKAMIDEYLDRKERFKHGQEMGEVYVKPYYEKYLESYPLTAGEDLAFDTAWKLIFTPSWEKIQEAVKNEVAKLQETLETKHEEMQQHFKAAKKHGSVKYTDDYYLSMIQLKLTEIFTLDNEIDTKREKSLISATDVMLRRKMIDTTGFASAEREVMIKLTISLLWESVYEHPQIIVPTIQPEDINKIRHVEDPAAWIKENEDRLKEGFKRYIFQGLGFNPGYMDMGQAYVSLLKKAQRSHFQLVYEK